VKLRTPAAMALSIWFFVEFIIFDQIHSRTGWRHYIHLAFAIVLLIGCWFDREKPKNPK
jgi:hypothetical protein